MRNTARSSGPFRHPSTWNTLSLGCDTVKNFAALMGFLSWLWAYTVILRTGSINGSTYFFFWGGDYCRMAGCLGCEPRVAQLQTTVQRGCNTAG